jgi:hypothetical protein
VSGGGDSKHFDGEHNNMLRIAPAIFWFGHKFEFSYQELKTGSILKIFMFGKLAHYHAQTIRI